MCDLCGVRVSRRRLLGGLAVGSAAAVTGSLLVGPDRAAAVPVTPGLTIRPREAWAGDDRAPTGPMGSEDVRFLLVHHTASTNGADPVAVMQGAYDFHTGPEKGWPDVAYNFFVDQFGVVWEGRAGSLAGPVEASATGGSQGYAQLVCLLGDFTAILPEQAALDSLNRTLAWLADRYGIPTEPGSTTTFTSRGSNLWPAGETVTANTISGHRDMSVTACPGDMFYPYLVTQVPAAVTALRTGAASPGPPETPSPPTTRPPDAPAPTSEPPAAAEPVPPATRALDTAPPTTNGPPTSPPITTPRATSTSVAPTAPPTTGTEGRLEVAAAPPPAPRGSQGPDTSGGGGSTGLALPLVGVTGVLAAAGTVWLVSRRSEPGEVTEPAP